MLDIKARFNNMKASIVYHGGQDDIFCTCECEAIYANLRHKIIVGTIVSCQATKHTYQSTFDLWLILLNPKELGQKW
jgi:hypothetical protein